MEDRSLPYIGMPIEEYADFDLVSWSEGIYPTFKGRQKEEETIFFVDLVKKINAKSILDLGLGGGSELEAMTQELASQGHRIDLAAGNEIDDEFIEQAQEHFRNTAFEAVIHKCNWVDLPTGAAPPYENTFDFAYLTGNSLTYIGGGTPEHTHDSQQKILNRFGQLIKPNGHLFIDSRNYDYIRSLMQQPREEIAKHFQFDESVYYHGTDEVTVFPAYISDQLVALHYYNTRKRIWGELDLHPIYQQDMIKMLSDQFELVAVYDDFREVNPSITTSNPERKTQFVQYLVRKR